MSDQEIKQNLHEKMQIQNDNNSQSIQQQINHNQQNIHQSQPQSDQNVEDIIQYEELNEEQYQNYVDKVQENSKRVINRDQKAHQEEEQIIQPMKNPVSAYLIFTMKWKAENPNKKFEMTQLGLLWKSLQPHEKRSFEEQFRKKKEKYDLYIASKLINNPNAQKDESIENKFFFPLHRIKAIMKQDKHYTPKTEAVAAMARATQYFGEYFLQELKKITEGKNRIDTKDLFQCISVNQRFGFLDCLIDDYAQSSKQKKSLKINNEQQQFKQKQSPEKDPLQLLQKKKVGRKPNQHPTVKPLPKGQVTLTGMFGFNSAK